MENNKKFRGKMINPNKIKYAFQFAKYLKRRYKLYGKILDVGSGEGEFKGAFEKIGLDYDAIDVQPKRDFIKKCDITQQRFPFNDNSFDVVFMRNVLEHINKGRETEHAIKEIKRVLKPGGKIIVMTENWDTNVKNFYDTYDHVSPYTLKSLKELFGVSGFKKIHARTFWNIPLVWRYFYHDLIFELRVPFVKRRGLFYVGVNK